MKTFLTARFRHLALVSWEVPPALLAHRLPPGVELDLERGAAVVSWVTLEFRETRVLGIPWPGFREFPDVNLRFYVRQGERRGVVFARELVTSAFVAWTARTLYGEPFDVAGVACRHVETEDRLRIERRVTKRGKLHRIAVDASGPPRPVVPGTDGWWLTERNWGFSREHRGTGRVVTHVAHVPWPAWNVRDHDLDVDFAALYGPEWDVLNRTKPFSVLLAQGSPVVVSQPWKEPA